MSVFVTITSFLCLTDIVTGTDFFLEPIRLTENRLVGSIKIVGSEWIRGRKNKVISACVYKLKHCRYSFSRVFVGAPSGGIITTSNDMAKYIDFHLNNGKVGDKQIISEVCYTIHSSSKTFLMKLI